VAKAKRASGRTQSSGARKSKGKRETATELRPKRTARGIKTRGAQTGTAKSTKIASMTVLLCRIKGVSLDELCKHTGWQPHSVRAVISSVIKKKLGLEVVSERIDGERIYRVVV
jgi:hypothetical protein